MLAWTPFIMHSSIGLNWGDFHPLLVHFPIVLFSATLVCDLLYNMGKRGALYVGHWLLLAGTFMCIPTLWTGWEAAEAFDPADSYIYIHRLLAFSLGAGGLFYSFLRAGAMLGKWSLHPLGYIILSVMLVALTSYTSDYGGLITHGKTPFSSRESPSSSI